MLCWSSRSPAASFLCAVAFAASSQLFAVLRFCAAGFRDALSFKLCTPSICQPLNVRIACSLTLCVRRVRRASLRWPAPGTCLTCLDGARRRPARMWCAPVLPSPPSRAYTMVWLGAVSSLKLRGAGGVCAGLACSRLTTHDSRRDANSRSEKCNFMRLWGLFPFTGDFPLFCGAVTHGAAATALTTAAAMLTREVRSKSS